MRTYLVRSVLAIAVISAAATGVANAQTPAPPAKRFEGNWQGALVTPQAHLRLQLTVTRDSAGALSGVVTSLDQGNARIPATLTSHGDTLIVDMPGAGANYTTVLSAAGDSLRGSFWQGGALPLNMGRAAPPPPPLRPQEPKAPFPYKVEDVTFQSVTGVTLAGTIITPTRPGPHPAVIFVSGSGPQDRNEEILDHKPFLVIADYLARHGIASLRYDDRGTAKSTGNFAASTGADFADDAEAALHFLQKRPGIARDRVGIIGHSEGGLVAPMVAARSKDVAFLVLLAGPGLPGDSIVLLQRAALGKLAGVPPTALARAMEADRRMFAAIRASRDSTDAAARLLEAQKVMVAAMPAEMQPAISQQLDVKRQGLLSRWWLHFATYDPRPTLQKVHVPVLAMNGALDMQVPSSANLPEIDAALKAGGNKDYRIAEMPGLNHLFQTATTGNVSEYQQITETISPAALELIETWITAHVRLKAAR